MAVTHDAYGGRVRPSAHGPISVLVAVALTLLVAGVVVLAAVHLVPSTVSLAPDPTPEAAAVAPPDPVVRATVVAAVSCAAAGARDTVTVDVAGTRRELPVESCGNRIGGVLDVEVPRDGAVRVRGTGASAVPGGGAGEASGPATRVAVVLTVVAALGSGGLFVVVARERRRPAGTPGRR